MLRRLALLNRNQTGLTLIELIVAMAITALVTGGITGSIFQIFAVSAQDNANMTAVKQVENAIHWISRDVLMTQIIEPSEGSGFPLNLTWIDFDDNNLMDSDDK